MHGLHIAFDFAIGACLVAAAASWSRGRHYVHADGREEQADDLIDAHVVGEVM
jgi:hypothetical protein